MPALPFFISVIKKNMEGNKTSFLFLPLFFCFPRRTNYKTACWWEPLPSSFFGRTQTHDDVTRKERKKKKKENCAAVNVFDPITRKLIIFPLNSNVNRLTQPPNGQFYCFCDALANSGVAVVWQLNIQVSILTVETLNAFALNEK